MKSTSKRVNKSSERIKQEIINDWTDVRRWIDELQTEWVERQRDAQIQVAAKTRQKHRKTST